MDFYCQNDMIILSFDMGNVPLAAWWHSSQQAALAASGPVSAEAKPATIAVATPEAKGVHLHVKAKATRKAQRKAKLILR